MSVFVILGGPGCSGLLGMFLEHGPFRVKEGGNLQINPYSWSTLAGVVFLGKSLSQ